MSLTSLAFGMAFPLHTSVCVQEKSLDQLKWTPLIKFQRVKNYSKVKWSDLFFKKHVPESIISILLIRQNENWREVEEKMQAIKEFFKFLLQICFSWC